MLLVGFQNQNFCFVSVFAALKLGWNRCIDYQLTDLIIVIINKIPEENIVCKLSQYKTFKSITSYSWRKKLIKLKACFQIISSAIEFKVIIFTSPAEKYFLFTPGYIMSFCLN